jgi:hypothetical protein
MIPAFEEQRKTYEPVRIFACLACRKCKQTVDNIYYRRGGVWSKAKYLNAKMTSFGMRFNDSVRYKETNETPNMLQPILTQIPIVVEIWVMGVVYILNSDSPIVFQNVGKLSVVKN